MESFRSAICFAYVSISLWVLGAFGSSTEASVLAFALSIGAIVTYHALFRSASRPQPSSDIPRPPIGLTVVATTITIGLIFAVYGAETEGALLAGAATFLIGTVASLVGRHNSRLFEMMKLERSHRHQAEIRSEDRRYEAKLRSDDRKAQLRDQLRERRFSSAAALLKSIDNIGIGGLSLGDVAMQVSAFHQSTFLAGIAITNPATARYLIDASKPSLHLFLNGSLGFEALCWGFAERMIPAAEVAARTLNAAGKDWRIVFSREVMGESFDFDFPDNWTGDCTGEIERIAKHLRRVTHVRAMTAPPPD